MLLRIIILLFLFPTVLMAQNTKPLISTDNSSQTCNTTRMVFSPGVLSCSGSVATISGGGGSGNVGIGTVNNFAGYVGVGTIGPFQTVEVAGNVGIGTPAPLAKLQVLGNVSVGASNATTDVLTVNAASSGTGISINGSSGGIGGIDTYTQLMAPLSSFPFTDISQNGYAITNTGITLDTVNSLLGASGSAYDDGSTSNYGLSIANTSNFNISSGDWTISFLYRPVSVITDSLVFAKYNGSAPFQGYVLGWYQSHSNQLGWSYNANNGAVIYSSTLSTGTWYYVELDSSGGTITMWLSTWNGSSWSLAVNQGTDTNPPVEFNTPLQIFNSTQSRKHNCNIQSFKFDKGIARHTSAFTPPTSPYTNSTASPTVTLANGITNLAQIQAKSSDNSLNILNNGSSAQYINSSNNVGVGSTNPGTKVDVNGTVRATAFNGNGIALTLVNTGTVGNPLYYSSSGATGNNLGPFTGVNYVGSNVGVGSLTPGQALDVIGTTRTTNFTMTAQTPISGYVLTASDSAGDATWSSPGSVSGWTVSGNDVYETSGGNVGIGTTIAPDNLYVAGSAQVTGQLKLSTAGLSIGTSNILVGTTGTGSVVVTNASPTISSPLISIVRGSSATTGTLTLEATSGNSPTVASRTIIQNTSGIGFRASLVSDSAGNIGLGTVGPVGQNFLVIGGSGFSATAGDSYTSKAAPNGGMIVEGNVGIGTWVTTGTTTLGGNCKTSTGDVCMVNGALGICTAGTFPACTTCTVC